MSIVDLIEKIKEKLEELEPDQMAMYQDFKLVYPMGKIRILPLNQTVES